MRHTFLLASAAALALTAAVLPASATVTQPNGLVVPLDSANGETQLYTLFNSLGEAIDWKTDAASTPDAFSPLCDFTAKFVLKQSGSSFKLGWYNSTNQAPTVGDVHVVFDVGVAVGTEITSADIKNDPGYAGGLIGFALLSTQPHFSESKWNQVCSGCNPPGPWVAAVIYASKNIPNAYYIAFEDGQMGTTPGSFGNDGDYNDDVYLLTGLTCSGGAQPCDTGLPGTCATGVTQCSPTGTTCKGLAAPAAETCNGLDDDCNGATDEGSLCPANFVCDKGSCVQGCNSGEFACAADKVCNAAGYCVDPACKDVTCDAGKVCIGGVCKAPCEGVTCPFPQTCLGNGCVDPCATVKCAMGQVCDKGACITECSCSPCAAGLACDAASGHCSDPSCVGVACGAGTHCVAGACVDVCAGAVCPSGQACSMGQCVAVMGTGAGGSSGTGFGFGGEGGTGSSVTGGTGSMATTTAGAGGGNGGAGGAGNETSSGCGCSVAGAESGDELALAGLLLAAVGVRRRRASRRA